jgi:ubiquitin-conjugating enzyme E2 D
MGNTLRELKIADRSHNENLIHRLAGTTNADHKRVLMILQTFQENTKIPYISLSPAGDDLLHLVGRVEGPLASPYEGGVFHVDINIHDDFPWSPPICRLLTKIYHPNIDGNGELKHCLSMLDPKDGTMEYLYLTPILTALYDLLENPDIDDPVVLEIAQLYLEDRKAFSRTDREFTLKYAKPDNSVAVVPIVKG